MNPSISKQRILFIRVATILVLLCCWEALGWSGLFYAGVIPSFTLIFPALWREVTDPTFYSDLGLTLFESGVGFLYGSVIAIVIGVWLGVSDYARKAIQPYIVAIGGTPKIIFLPILFLFFGLGIESKIAKGALSAFFPVVLAATSGFLQIPPVFRRIGQSFNVSRWQMVWKIYLPAMANPLMTGLRLGMAVAIIGVLSAEVTYANLGIGHRLIRKADQFRVPEVYALIILIFSVTAFINTGLAKIQARFNKHERRREPAARLSVPRSSASYGLTQN